MVAGCTIHPVASISPDHTTHLQEAIEGSCIEYNYPPVNPPLICSSAHEPPITPCILCPAGVPQSRP
jgi:hypothetical protein